MAQATLGLLVLACMLASVTAFSGNVRTGKLWFSSWLLAAPHGHRVRAGYVLCRGAGHLGLPQATPARTSRHPNRQHEHGEVLHAHVLR